MIDSDNNTTNRLTEAYEGLQAQLTAGLNVSRRVIDHPGATGDGTEAKWLKILKDHLPTRYQAEKAFIVDSDGTQSEQIDIVIYDRQYTPELYNVDGQKVIPAEGVYAALEVKQTLDKRNIEYAGQKVSSVRKLNRTSAPIVHAGGEHDPRNLTPILGGILATESSWNPAYGDPFEACLRERTPDEHIDIGCVVSSGGFELRYDSDDVLSDIHTSSAEQALSFFFLHLLHRLQRIGTVPAIEYQAYLDAFNPTD